MQCLATMNVTAVRALFGLSVALCIVVLYLSFSPTTLRRLGQLPTDFTPIAISDDGTRVAGWQRQRPALWTQATQSLVTGPESERYAPHFFLAKGTNIEMCYWGIPSRSGWLTAFRLTSDDEGAPTSIRIPYQGVTGSPQWVSPDLLVIPQRPFEPGLGSYSLHLFQIDSDGEGISVGLDEDGSCTPESDASWFNWAHSRIDADSLVIVWMYCSPNAGARSGAWEVSSRPGDRAAVRPLVVSADLQLVLMATAAEHVLLVAANKRIARYADNHVAHCEMLVEGDHLRVAAAGSPAELPMRERSVMTVSMSTDGQFVCHLIYDHAEVVHLASGELRWKSPRPISIVQASADGGFLLANPEALWESPAEAFVAQ